MTDAIRERGPDDEGQWIDEGAGIALGHRRLSIIDLTAAGHQPMVSTSGRYVIIYNGEIYNHLTLRAEIEASTFGQVWRGHSDTETLLAGVERWGLKETLCRCTGMFGLALWDRERRELHLARDRMGEKPVYFGWQGQGKERAFLFGSDLKALWPHPSFVYDIDRKGLTSLMRFGHVVQPLSIFNGISKLAPGMVATVSLERSEPLLEYYWDFRAIALDHLANPLTGSADETTAELEQLLKQAISMQMEADVPVGAFLSGGVDSSTIVALMQEIARERGLQSVRTFTIGFEEEGYDEAPFAKAVAKHLGTTHTEHYASAADALDVIPRLSSIYSEPFADSSQIPTFLVSGVARDCVTVSLSGDAGDELFCGYTRYFVGEELLHNFNRFPRWSRNLGLAALKRLRPELLARIYRGIRPILPGPLQMSNIEDKFRKMEHTLEMQDSAENAFYSLLISQWDDARSVVIGGNEANGGNAIPAAFSRLPNYIEQMMLADSVGYLPNDILCKVDRAAMAVSLETRVPLLDHAIVEHALRTPLSHKLRNGMGKWPLRQILYKRVPRELIERPKKGFGIPLDSWLRGPLRDWAEDLLSEQRLREEGYFDVEKIRKATDLHMSGASNEASRLWCVLMFQAWLSSHRDEWASLKTGRYAHV